MQFSPDSYQLFLRTKNTISDKVRSCLLFTAIPSAPSRHGEAAFPSFLSASSHSSWSARQGQRTQCTGNEPEKDWAASPLGPHKRPPVVPLHQCPTTQSCTAWLFCHSSPVIPFQNNWRKETGQNVDSHCCNRHNTCYCDSDPIKITLTLIFLCMLVEERAQLAPFPLSHPVFASLKQFAPADWITLPTHWVCHKRCLAFSALNRPFCPCCTCGGTEGSEQPCTHAALG